MKKNINNVQVKPYVVTKQDPKNNAGYQLFPELYANIFICARKKSGKTCVIGKILEECTTVYGQDRYGFFGPTTVFIISSTVDKDPTYQAIRNILEQKGIPVVTATEVADLPDFIESVSQTVDAAKAISEAAIESKPKKKETSYLDQILYTQQEEPPEQKKIRIRKSLIKNSPRFIFVFDDLGEDLRNKDVTNFVKKNRHYLSKVIVSSQHPYDLLPSARMQIEYWILFKGHEGKNLEDIYKNADVHISFPLFKQLYEESTHPYNFLYVDSKNSEFRHNFNQAYNTDT